jgi:peptidyl-prolyl cis-trans isomerase D
MLGYLRSGNKRTKLIWWVVTISTVATFLLGFSFFGAMGRDPSNAARQSGSFGLVNGEKIPREMWLSAFENERQAYRQRFGTDPTDRDLRAVQQGAWRKLVNTRLMSQEAARSGLKVTDNDIVFRLETDPPPSVLGAPAFQTDGRFDPQKYRAAISNPANDWSALEAEVRDEIPAMKLQKALLSSIKLSESELREAMLDRSVRLSAVVLRVPPADTGKAATSEAELQRVYMKYRPLMASPAKTQLEMLAIPVKFTDEEVKTANDLATSLYQRVQKGEDFVQLTKDYSEGPNPERGGNIDRVINVIELGPLAQVVSAHKPGDVIPPIRQGNAIVMFRILGPAQDSSARNLAPGTVKLGQLTIKIHPNADGLRTQYAAAQAIATRAKTIGLAKASAEKGLTTQKTSFFDLDNMPQELYATPQTADWGVSHKKGEVSDVFESPEAFVIASVAFQHPAGIPTREEIAEQLPQLVELDRRVELAKARADQVSAALKGGASLEDAGKAIGLAALPATFTRAEPDPRLASVTELLGALWGAKPGVVVGPFRTPTGYYFGRVTGIANPPDTLLASQQFRGQVTGDVLGKRQRSFFSGYMTLLREHSKIEDDRGAFGAN